MVQVMSSEQKFLNKVNLILRKIQSEKTINRYVLCRMTNITKRQYSDLHQYIVEAYADKVSFDDNTKNWTWIGEAPKTPETLEEALKNDD